MGTPHRGSTAAGVGELVRKAASFVLMDTNSLVLNSLALRNSDLERCQDTFSSLWSKYNFQVKTFQEGLPLELPLRLGQSKMTKIVPDISSCLGDWRERAEILNGDHRSMCRYANTKDPNYKKVSTELRNVYEHLHNRIVQELIHKKQDIQHMKYPEMFFRQLSIGLPEDDTCQWLLGTASFKAWIQRDNANGLLQIIGKPGSGKSNLMRWVLEIIETKVDIGTCVLSHFFNGRGEPLEHSFEGLIRSILYQLWTQHLPSLIVTQKRSSDTQVQKLDAIWYKWLGTLKSKLEQIFSDPDFAPQRTIILIDALDECDSQDVPEILYFLDKLMTQARIRGVQLDVCVSRREYPNIAFKNTLEIHMDRHNVVGIEQYTRRRFEMAGIPERDIGLWQTTISEKSSGIFLWVVLVVDMILKEFANGENNKFVLTRIKSLPQTLGALYAEIIKDIMAGEDSEMALRLLQWAILATDRLRVREWHHILAFIRKEPPDSLEEWKESDYYTTTDAQLERKIKALSRGLVEIQVVTDTSTTGIDIESIIAGAGSLDSTTGDSRIVRPIHETVAEFFVNGDTSWAALKAIGYHFVGDGHLQITSTCLDYLLIEELNGLVSARRRAQSAIQDQTARGRARACRDKHGSWLRRSDSATSFMSSASSHSSIHDLGIKDNGASEPLQTPELVKALNEKVFLAASTLGDDPALMSYALNRMFVHARAALAQGKSPDEILLKKLIKHRCWMRWYFLQEDFKDIHTWQDVLYSQELCPWISEAERIIKNAKT
ncbi:hypothetical protein F4777DRAFT_247196 [Nemania sp. FL0916]|nr:hypothetical protein F4777DRAFT_247196 [Nemania sp. FL0916]